MATKTGPMRDAGMRKGSREKHSSVWPSFNERPATERLQAYRFVGVKHSALGGGDVRGTSR